MQGVQLIGRMRLAVALVAAAALATGSTGATASSTKTRATARAFSVQVTAPGQGAATATVSAPPNASALAASFAYPDDGSILSTGAISATASTSVGGGQAASRATSDVSSLQIFGGEITASNLSTRANATAGPRASSGSVGGSSISGLVVLGQPVSAAPGQRIALADWGYAVVLAKVASSTSPAGLHASRTSMTTLDIHLTADHGGLPAGSEILLGYAESSAQATATASKGHKSHHRKVKHRSHRKSRGHGHKQPPPPPPVAPEPSTSPFAPAPIQPPPASRKVRLTGGGYVFPVFGPVSFSDTFGAARADVSSGWHHGDDIFAPLGAPVLAVAKGSVFSVGWNDIGGNRLWLTDRQGNQFYYAHLSAFSPLAVNGARVNAGDVLGFIGNTGDAVGTPYHLHFEIHPVSMLGLGYDGVINPTRYLEAWQRLRDIAFPSRTAADAGFASSGAKQSSAPQPGAILLHVSDISSATSLDSASVKKALALTYSTVTQGDNTLVGAPAGAG